MEEEHGTRYELWHGESGNAIGDYDSEGEALAVVAEAIRRNGRESVAHFALLRVNTDGEGQVITFCDHLATRAFQASEPPASLPA